MFTRSLGAPLSRGEATLNIRRMMVRTYRASMVIALLLLTTACGPLPLDQPLRVVATILPLADWAEEVGGERVHVQLIVPAGLDPRTYEPSEEQRTAIRSADVVLLNGLGLEPWIDEILDQAGRNIVVLDVSQFTGPLVERVPLNAPTAQRNSQGPVLPRARPRQEAFMPAPIRSPYLWLDPRSAMGQVDLIAQTLTRADPGGLPIYRQNAARYKGELENLDVSIQHRVDAWTWRSVLGDNLFLYPFARHYNLALRQLDEAATFAPVPAAQPLLLDALSASVDRRPATALRRPVAVLNPLAGETYIQLMQTNIHTMTQVMRKS